MTHPLPIDLVVPGATPEAIWAGINAAWAVFEAHDAWPWDAAAAYFDMEWLAEFAPDDAPEMSPEQLALAGVWDDAQDAAFAAAWPGQTFPHGCSFGLGGVPSYVRPRYVRELVPA